MNSEQAKLLKKALLLEWILIFYNVIEAGVSISFGALSESIALFGFGLDSCIEVAAAGIIVWHFQSFTVGEESKSEKRALFLIGTTFFLLAAYVLYDAGLKLIHQTRPHASLVGIIVASLSLLIMPTIGIMKKKIAVTIGSRALQADAMETLLCSYLSFALLLGLGLNALFGWWWADPVAALVMIYFMIKEGWEAIKEAKE